mgnify:CR=1 FL=1
MSEEIKFTEEELKRIEEIKAEYFNIQSDFGNLVLTRIKIDEQLNELDRTEVSLKEKLASNEDTERAFIKDITSKYGDGTLNPETGVFIPNK